MVEEAQTNEVDEALAQLVLVMEDVKDPRGRQGRRHLLASVLSIAVLGCLCGCDDAEALQDWAEKEEDWLTDYLELQWGVPSQDTFLRVLAAVDQSEFRWAFHRWVRNALPKAVAADQIAVDGKAAVGERLAEKLDALVGAELSKEQGDALTHTILMGRGDKDLLLRVQISEAGA